MDIIVYNTKNPLRILYSLFSAIFLNKFVEPEGRQASVASVKLFVYNNVYIILIKIIKYY